MTEETLPIEGKFQQVREVQNRLTFIFASNNELNSLPLDMGDRRITKIKVSPRFKRDGSGAASN